LNLIKFSKVSFDPGGSYRHFTLFNQEFWYIIFIKMDIVHDCVLYIIFIRTMPVAIDGTDLSGFDVDQLKCLYVGITNNPIRRGQEHSRKEKKKIIYKSKKKRQPKLNAHIYKNGWKAYDMIVLKTGMTREEACKLEIETIEKYRTFELGLNSTPGGECGSGVGADHHRAQAVNLFNCKTGEIHSFLWMGAAAEFLGYDKGENYVSGVSQAANPCVDCAQIRSKTTGEWFQAKRAYDKMPFMKDMPTPSEKMSGADNPMAQAVILFEWKTGVTIQFSWMGAAAEFLGLDKSDGGGRVSSVANLNVVDVTQIQSKKTGGWFQAKYVYDETPFKKDMPTRYEKVAKALEKAVVAYDEDDELVYRFDSGTKAADATKINDSHIFACATHKRPSAGKKDGRELSWEYEDPVERAKYDRDLPRKPKKPIYYMKNGEKNSFKTVRDASRITRGKYAVVTQWEAITASIKTEDETKLCKDGHKWFKL
jgi:hypothetical protein